MAERLRRAEQGDQLPDRDRRNGVTTLKCATAHGPRSLTGLPPPKIYRPLPSNRQDINSVSVDNRRASAGDEFFRSLRISFSAACLFRLDWTSTSRTSPSASTARQGIVRAIFRTVFGCGSFRPWATRSDISTARQRSFVWS